MHSCLTLADGLGLLPEAASTNEVWHDPLWNFITLLSGFFFVLIITMMVFLAIKYRRKDPGQEATSQHSHSNALEIAWSLPPLLIVMLIFWLGLSGYLSMAKPVANTMRIDVQAEKWFWTFNHPVPGTDVVLDDNELLIPKGVPIEIVMTSKDVIHSLYIPAFRTKKDAVPGRYTKVYFEATKAGEYPLYCTEYCGTSHSTMLAKVIVFETHAEWAAEVAKRSALPFKDLPDELYAEWKSMASTDDFEAFRTKAAALDASWAEKSLNLKPAHIRGEEIATKKGCFTCHSIDGTRLTGPTWQNLFGTMRTMNDGQSFLADDNYIRESILYPREKIVATFAAGQMNSFQGQLTERDIDAIIAYLRTLKQD